MYAYTMSYNLTMTTELGLSSVVKLWVTMRRYELVDSEDS